MSDNAQTKYDVTALGTSVPLLAPKVSAAPLPLDIIRAFALRVVGDSTGALNPIVRTVDYTFIPTVVATATLSIDSSTAIRAVTMVLNGSDYILPPLVTISDANRKPVPPRAPNTDAILRAFLDVEGVDITAGGAGYAAPTATFLGGLPPANRDFSKKTGAVRYIIIRDRGRGYVPGTTVSIEGGGPAGASPTRQAKATVTLTPGGRIRAVTITDMGAGYISVPQVVFHNPPTSLPPPEPAKAFAAMAEGRPAAGTVTTLLGVVTAVTITDKGDGYVSVPDIVISDAAGVGAVAVAKMGVGRVDIIKKGSGYTSVAIVVFTPAFKVVFPDSSDQRALFFHLAAGSIQKNALSPVISETPTLS